MNTTKELIIGESYKTLEGKTIIVRSIISKRIAKVSWGFDSIGNDILGLISIEALTKK